jgi:hypothetical protein
VIIWSRPIVATPGTPFCAVVGVDASVHTACGGRWEPSREDEIRWRVAHGERCGGCVREIVVGRVGESVYRDPKPENAIQPAAPDDASDPTWTGEGPRLAKQRLERREGK